MPVTSCFAMTGCLTGMGYCVPGRPTTSVIWTDWWPARCQLTVGLPSAAPWRSAARGGLLPLAVHIKPVSVLQPDYGGRYVAALVLLVEPGQWRHIDPGLAAEALGLTPMESRVAVWLAEGKSVEDIARVTDRTTNTLYWHLKNIYQKLYISRQADLIRLVLSLTGSD